MCEFTQREYSCGHFRFIAARWCNSYKITHRRCQPDVTHFEFRQHEICGICQPYEMPPWFHSVKVASMARPPASVATSESTAPSMAMASMVMATPPSTAAPPSLSTRPASMAAPKAASHPACPSSCSRRRRSLGNASPKSPSTAKIGKTAKTKLRPPIPLFSATTALKSQRAV